MTSLSTRTMRHNLYLALAVAFSALVSHTFGSALITLSLVLVNPIFGRYHLLVRRLEIHERADLGADTAAVRSKERLRSLLEAAPDTLFRVTPTGGFVEPYRNDAESERQPDRLDLGLVVARQPARLIDGDVAYQRKNGLSLFIFSLPKAA